MLLKIKFFNIFINKHLEIMIYEINTRTIFSLKLIFQCLNLMFERSCLKTQNKNQNEICEKKYDETSKIS